MTTIFDVPKELVIDILLRVPITCLGAVRSTCKQWNALSKESILYMGFIMKKKKKKKLCLLRFDVHGNFNKHEVDKFQKNPSIKEIGNLFNQTDISKVIQCDGLLLCVIEEYNTRLVVWNPYLGQTRWIQAKNTRYQRSDSYAIGYDNNRKHKILRVVHHYDDEANHVVSEYEIYDFTSNSWKVLDITTPTWEIASRTCASLKGNTYFIANGKQVYNQERGVEHEAGNLLCFDFTTECFGQFLSLPFVCVRHDVRALSSLRDEKLAALYSRQDTSTDVEIWVTAMIEPNAVSWNPFLKVDMKPHCGSGFHFRGTFFIDEVKKVALVFHCGESDITDRYEDAAYIIGENGNVKKVHLGVAVPSIQRSFNLFYFVYCSPLVCCTSYIPGLVQINQKKEKKRKRMQYSKKNEKKRKPTN